MNKLLVAGAALTTLLAGTAMAADMPVRAPAPPPVYRAPPPVIYTWTGCYVGVQGGWTWGNSRHDSAIGPITDTYNVEGGLAGGTLGCNYQAGLFVLGVEGDYSWVGKKGEGPDIPPFSATAVAETRETALWTVRGRFGIAPDDRWLVYVTGGYAGARVQAHVVNVPLGIDVSESKTRNGWTAGVGVEWVFWDNWSAKGEYLYVGLNNASYFDAPPAGVTTRTGVPIHDHVIRFGINYRFGWGGGPVVAKY
jgi:outer membrane immunogenic protein